MDWYYIVLIIVGAFILLLFSLDFVIAYYLTKFIIEPYCKPLPEVLETEFKINKMSKEEYENYYVPEEYVIKSKYFFYLCQP